MNPRQYNRRLFAVGFFLTVIFVLYIARLLYLHLGSHEQAETRIRSARSYTKETAVLRGRIYDRQSNLLALDLPTAHVCVDPKFLHREGYVEFTVRHLSRLLDMDREDVARRLSDPDDPYVRLKRFVPAATIDTIRRLQLKGVHFEDAVLRQYPHDVAMSHVLGFMNWQGDGCGGIEQVMQDYLRGRPGLRISQRTGGMKPKEMYSRRSLDIQPRQGADIYLTLDLNIQYMVENALDRAVEAHSAKGAWAIVQRVRTGEILAMASRPAFDLNAFRESTKDVQLNRAVSYVYEPGSTFKVAVIASALNEDLVTPGQIIDCENGSWFYRGRPLRDFHGYDELTVADVLKKSSNIGAAKIALRLGEKKLEQYLRDFGVGRATGIELPGEEEGLFYPRSRWSAISITRIAMGHEVGVTALQMLNIVSAIANGGRLMRPTIIRRMVDINGRTLYEMEPEMLGRPLRESTALTMQKLLARVTQSGGTGRRAQIPDYGVAGKTGTAQKAVPGGYSDDANMASFVGFLPAHKPEIAVIVVVDEPQPDHTGGVVAAPVFRDIAEQAVRYLHVAPENISNIVLHHEIEHPAMEESRRDTRTVM